MSEEPIIITIAGDWRIYEAACLHLRPKGAATPRVNGSSIATPHGTLQFAGDTEQATITAMPRSAEDVPFWTELLSDLAAMAERLAQAPQAPWRKRTTDSIIEAYYRARAAGDRKITLKQLAERHGVGYSWLRQRKMAYDAAGKWGAPKNKTNTDNSDKS
jgi:hypothetical protein